MAIKEGGTYLTFRDPNGNVLASINRDGSVLAQAIDFPDGTVQTTAAAGGAVSSVFGRTGAVAAVSGDYTAAQIGVAALPNGVTATTQAVGNSTTSLATTAYVLASKFNPTILGSFSGETSLASSVLSFTTPSTANGSLVRISCSRIILAAADTSFTQGTIVTHYNIPVLNAALNFTITAASLDGSSTLTANTPGAAYTKTFCLFIHSNSSVTVTMNGTLSDAGSYDSWISMAAEIVVNP